MPIKFWRYFLINAILVSTFFALFLSDYYGANEGFAYDIVLIALATALPVIYFQYKLLNLKNNWIYKSMIFYIGMILFLFLFGIIIAWDQKVGSNAAGSWLARLDSGVRFIIYGQLFGGLLGFPVIVFINYLFQNWIFEKK